MNATTEFHARLDELLKGFRFEAGRPARKSDGVVDVWVHFDKDEQGREHLILTLYAGFPPPSKLVGGLPWAMRGQDGTVARSGVTTARGQVHLVDLPRGEYALEVKRPT